jgi:hypothetical protein
MMQYAIGQVLAKLRKSSGTTHDDIQQAGLGSSKKTARNESGRQLVRLPDLHAYCDLYGATQEVRDQLVEMRRNSDTHGWWERYGSTLPPGFSQYVRLEAEAAKLWNYGQSLVHGLLQTSRYQEELLQSDPNLATGTARHFMTVRAERQRAVFERSPPLEIVSILDESALFRRGDPRVLRDQFEHLRLMSAGHTIDIRILPEDHVFHGAMQGGFDVLDILVPKGLLEQDKETRMGIVYTETPSGASYQQDQRVVDLHRRILKDLVSQSVPVAEWSR